MASHLLGLEPLPLPSLRRRALNALSGSCACPQPENAFRWNGCPTCWVRVLRGFPVSCAMCCIAINVEILNGRESFQTALDLAGSSA